MNSGWRKKWREDCRRVLCAMTGGEIANFQRWGLERSQGRRAFMDAAHRLELDIAYSTCVMEQATLEPSIIFAAA